MEIRRTSTHVGFLAVAVAVAAAAAMAVVVEVLDSILLFLAIDQSRVFAGRGMSSGAWLEIFSLLVRSDAVTFLVALTACLLLAFRLQLTSSFFGTRDCFADGGIHNTMGFFARSSREFAGLSLSVSLRVFSLWGLGLRRWLFIKPFWTLPRRGILCRAFCDRVLLAVAREMGFEGVWLARWQQ